MSNIRLKPVNIAVRVEAMMPGTCEDVCHEATMLAIRLNTPVVFNWNQMFDFVVYPSDDVASVKKQGTAYKRMSRQF